MFPEFEYFPVNWKDGMQVSSTDFISSQDAFRDDLRDLRAIAVNELSYGLLPCDQNPEPHHYPQFGLESQGNLIELYLKECRAITIGGHRIEWTGRMVHKLRIPRSKFPSVKIENRDGEYYIGITVDPFKSSMGDIEKFRNIQVGADSQKGQPRKLNTISYYQLDIIREEEWEIGPNRMIIGKLVIADSNPTIDEVSFIPACTSINSHHELKNLVDEVILKPINKVLDNCIKTMRQTKFEKESTQKTHARNAYLVAEKLAFYIESIYSQLKFEVPFRPPIYVLSLCLNLAKNFQLSMRLLRDEGAFREKYLTDCRVEEDDMNTILDKLLTNTNPEAQEPKQYSAIKLMPIHANIKPSIDLVGRFLDILEQFTRKLIDEDFQEEINPTW